MNRRGFLRAAALGAGALAIVGEEIRAADTVGSAGLHVADLPAGGSPAAVVLTHFPSRLHAFVWRNWDLVPTAQLARVAGGGEDEIRQIGSSVGLEPPPQISADQLARSYITIIRRNWHLLPYEQLLELLGWTADKLAFILREDDFLFIKLGGVKPACAPIHFTAPTPSEKTRAREIASLVSREFPRDPKARHDPLFGFVERLSKSPPRSERAAAPGAPAAFSPRFCYSYFALYGDPLLDKAVDPYPDGYLDQLAETGVNGVWLQGVLHKLAPFPWDERLSAGSQQRLQGLRALVARARARGIGVYLYLNEPRAMPLRFYETHPELKGAVEGGYAALCTSHPETLKFITGAVASIVREVPDLGGFFTISGSENLTNCWSHNGGASCPRCGKRTPAEVIAELHNSIHQGIRQGGGAARLIVWDWGWREEWVEGIIGRLPKEAALMSVSEWDLPIQRGGVRATVGEYSISSVGPGPRAARHWEMARRHGLRSLAKIQAGNSWELSAVPYIPAIENVARHAANLRRAKVDGLMLGWTLGGYPSPNLEVVAEIAREPDAAFSGPDENGVNQARLVRGAMLRVAVGRFGKFLGPAVMEAWREFSAAFSEFPFEGGVVYQAPLQSGPANLLWARPTGYRSTMVGFPYDDLDGWRQSYPPEIFIQQLDKIAGGFAAALEKLHEAIRRLGTPARPGMSAREDRALADELNVAEAAEIHFRSTANQARFYLARRRVDAAKPGAATREQIDTLEEILKQEIELARRLHKIQSRDSRIGFEASNQYYYTPSDLVEKVINCRNLLDRWIPTLRNEG